MDRNPLLFFFNGVFLSYVFTLARGLLYRSKILIRIYNVCLFLLLSALFTGSFLIFNIFHSFYNEDITAAIIGSNINETQEFLISYVSWHSLFIFIALNIGLFLLFRYIDKMSVSLHRYVSFVFFLVMLVSIASFLSSPLEKKGIYGKVAMFYKVKSPDSYAPYLSDPKLSCDTLQQPQNVVLILGESFSKEHSSLYGYSQPTNPELSALRDSGSLFVYDSVISPATTTIPSVKQVMSMYDASAERQKETAADRPWYAFTNIPQVMKLSGYKTFWASNHCSSGFFDNIIEKYADLCDVSLFVDRLHPNQKEESTDDKLIDVVAPLVGDEAPKKFFVLHLLGSHNKFSERYTPDYQVFNAEDYPKLPEPQRQIIADYDNTVLFNDHVVAELIRLFQDSNAIVIYFSDHSLDLFQTTPLHFGHATANPASIELCRKIPYMVYLSPAYMEKYPDKVAQIRSAMHQPFNTTDMIYRLMALIGTEMN